MNENLAKAAKPSLRLVSPEQQLILLCDTSEHAADYVPIIEDHANRNLELWRVYALVLFRSHWFCTGQMTLTMYAQDFLAMHFTFDEFGHVFWSVKKPFKFLADNKILSPFFHTKQIPPKLRNVCDHALQFNFIFAHVPSIENPVLD